MALVCLTTVELMPPHRPRSVDTATMTVRGTSRAADNINESKCKRKHECEHVRDEEQTTKCMLFIAFRDKRNSNRVSVGRYNHSARRQSPCERKQRKLQRASMLQSVSTAFLALRETLMSHRTGRPAEQ